MKNRLAHLALCRCLLRLEISALRFDIAEIAQGLHRPITVVDSVVGAWKSVKQHPALIGGLVTAALALRRGGFFGLAHTGGRLLFLYPSLILFASKMFPSTSKQHITDQEIPTQS